MEAAIESPLLRDLSSHMASLLSAGTGLDRGAWNLGERRADGKLAHGVVLTSTSVSLCCTQPLSDTGINNELPLAWRLKNNTRQRHDQPTLARSAGNGRPCIAAIRSSKAIG